MTSPKSSQRFAGHGLVVDSEVALMLREQMAGPEPVDLRLNWGGPRPVSRVRPPGSPLAEVTDDSGALYFSFTRSEDEVVLRYPELCDFVGDPGLRRVRVDPHPDVDQGLISVLGSGALLAVHLALRGDLVLHASCVEVNGDALAFVGASGMGKSTMAALMVGAGHPLVSDDVLRTTVSATSGVTVFPGGIEGRLRDQARDLARTVNGATLGETADGRLSLRPELTSSGTLPLRACVIPLPNRREAQLTVRRLSMAAALRRLLQFPRIVGWSDAGILRSQFQAAADLAGSVPIYEADVPWGPPFDESLPKQIVDSVS